MRPKGKLLALLVMFAAVAGLTATGAFTTVEADRTATVETAGDDNALLGLDVHSDSEFANTGGDTIQITLNDTDSNSDAQGVNLNATTSESETLNITNNGQDPIDVNITVSTSNGEAAFYTTNTTAPDDSTSTSAVSSISGLADSSVASTDSYYVVGASTGNGGTVLSLDPGDKVTLGLYIDTTGMTNSNNAVFDGDTITITAEEDTSS